MPLLEREAQLASLGEYAGEARHGAGRMVLESAGQLFIPARTADHHVRAVLAKLGAPSREVAASRAARLGLAAMAER